MLGLLLALFSNLEALFIRSMSLLFPSLDRFCFSSCRSQLPGGRFRRDSDGPDEAQQFAS